MTETRNRQASDANGGALRSTIVLAIALVFPTLGVLLYFVASSGGAAMQLAYGSTKVLQFAFPVAFVFWTRTKLRRPLADTAPAGAGIPSGLVFGGAVAAAMIGLYFSPWLPPSWFEEATPRLKDKLTSAGIETRVAFLALATFYCLAHSFLEEYYWRWFVYGIARKKMSGPAAIALSSVGFASHHVVLLAMYFDDLRAVVGFSAGVAAGGVAWAWIYEKSGRLRGPWLSHLLVDAAIMAIGYHLLFA